MLALSRLRGALTELGPDLTLPGGVNTTALGERVAPLIAHGLGGLVYHRRSSGAWGWRTYVDTAPSPSKTSLCLMAVAAAAGKLTAVDQIASVDDAELEVGGVTGGIQRKRPTEIVAEAAQWLLRNHHRWEMFVEDDKDVQGTAWEHMAYALGVQGVLRAGGNPYDQRLAKAWRLMDDLWDSETGMWNEPGASGRRATIRAAFYTVSAYEEARLRISQMSMTEKNAATGPGDGGLEAAEVEIRTVRLDPDGLRILLTTYDDLASCTVSERLFTLAQLLDQAGPDGRAVGDIAAALHVAPSSVAKYVQRLNQAVARGFGGAAVKLVAPCATPHGSGYTLLAATDRS